MGAEIPVLRLRASIEAIFSPASDMLAIVERSKVTIWDIHEGKAIARNAPIKDPSSVAFSPDGRHYAVKTTSGAVMLYRLDEPEPITRYRPRKRDEGSDILFSSDGRYLIDPSWSGRIVVREVPSLAEDRVVTFPQCMIVDASSSADGKRWAFAVGVKLDNPESSGGDFVTTRGWPDFDAVATDYRLGSWSSIHALCLTPEGASLGIVHYQHEVGRKLSVVDVASGLVKASIPHENSAGTGFGLAVSPDGRLFATFQNGRFTVYRDDLREIISIEAKYPSAVAFSADGRWLALGGWDRGMVISTAGLDP